MLRIVRSSDSAAVERLLDRSTRVDPTVERRVAAIVEAVKRDGDRAVLAYARQFDMLDAPLEVSAAEIAAGAQEVPSAVRGAIRQAAARIRAVARRQVPRGWRIRTAPGVDIEQRVSALERVGCYVPGGRYPLPSSLLMTAIPAKVAGVRDVIVVCPKPSPVVMAAAREAGVSRVFRIGGAHAIAALAYGTATIPRVDKIVGPGNQFVAAAKSRVAPDCPVDLHAGPSEIAIVAAQGKPAWIAADLLAQAEHDPSARAILITPSHRLAARVAQSVERALAAHPSAREAMVRHGAVIVTRSMAEAIDLVNRLAPEHLMCENDRIASLVKYAGAIFVGPYAAEAAGDYATGSNHVLPTGGAARSRGGLSAADFVRTTSVQRVSESGLAAIAASATTLADSEGLSAHAASITIRVPSSKAASGQQRFSSRKSRAGNQAPKVRTGDR
jgi:histidinol dehydrogenase